MKNFAILSLLFFVSWNLTMQGNNVITQLELHRLPAGSHICFPNGASWKIEENSLYGNKIGKAVLLHSDEMCGKVVYEWRQTIEIGFSKHSGKYNFTRTLLGKTTHWGMLINGSLLAVLAATVSATLAFA